MQYKYIGKPALVSFCESAGEKLKYYWSCHECEHCPGKINGECPFWLGAPREGFKEYFERVKNVGDQ